jgi:hypothetical protein
VERRAHTRFPKTFEIEGAPAEGSAVARMVASDLSLGGLYCTSTVDFPEMTRLGVRMLLPSTEGQESPVDLEAVVVRRKKHMTRTGNARYELGLFFPRLTDEQREIISSFLARS